MADIAIYRINYKSDFILTLQSDAGWLTPFCIKFWTGAPSQAYYAYYDGMSYTHCAPVEGEPTKLLVQFDDHHLPIGDLKFQIGYHFTVADFPTSVEDEVINQASVIIEVDNAPAQVMLDFNGETAPEIQFALPAYANEAQRIANEQARIAAEERRISNEEARITAEQTRQQNEQQRISNEEARIREFARLKTQSEAATDAANNAAALANDKAQLAADNAALAQAAADLANAKAQLAADKAALAQAAATLANEKAALAQQKAEYAQEQGDAAKTEAETAHALNEEVRDDEDARDHAEQTRQQQEAARQTAEAQRVIDFNTQMQQQQTAYTEAEAARETAFSEAEQQRDAKVDEKVADITNLQAQVGYFVCDTDAAVAAKTITATGYVLTTGGNIRIKMTHANTADAVTLNINNTGAKALYYNGKQASSTNSWEEGEVIEVYYDGTQFMCANGGGGKFATGERVKNTNITNDVIENSEALVTAGAVYSAVNEGVMKNESLVFNPRKLDHYAISISDGSVVSVESNLKSWISEFILLRAGQTIDLFNIATYEGYCCLALYSSNDESSFIEGIEGSGSRDAHDYSYTAQVDTYIRIGSNKNVSSTFRLLYSILIENGSLFKSQSISDALRVELNYSDSLVFLTRSQSQGCLCNVVGCDMIKITANSSHSTSFALLNDYPDSIISAQTVPDFFFPALFYVPSGETVCIDVSLVNYIFFSGSTDRFPNSFPVTLEYKYAKVNELVQEDDDAWYIGTQPTSIDVNVGNYVPSDYINIEGAEKLTFKLFGTGQRPSFIYDANYKPLKKFGYGTQEGWCEDEVSVPLNAKYITYCNKYLSNNPYIKVYYKVKTNAQEVEDKIVAIRNLVANAGYHYLADSYGITTDNNDNTEAMQTLVDLVNYNGGGIIELGIGTFNVAGQIQWKSNVGLIGQGQDITIIKNTATSGSLQGTFYGDNVNNVIFRDFTIDATESTTGKGMFMRYIEDGVFENLRIVGTIPTGLGIDFIDRVKIVNCNIYGCGRGRWSAIPSGVGCSGIGIGTGWAGHQENFIITNCICEGNYNNGIFVEDQSRWSSGVMSDGSGQIIANNICRNGRNCGFSIWGGKNVTFANNISYNNAGAGFEIGYYALDGKFTGNQAIGNKYGFVIGSIVHDTNHIVFEANEVRGNTTIGISITTNSLVNNIVIKENELYDNTTAMNISGNSTGLVIRDNDERGSTTGITIAGEHTDAVIAGNAYFTQPIITATYTGITTFVEQFMP